MGQLDQCELCKGYLLSFPPVGICGECALAVTRRRHEVEAQGGRLLVCHGEVLEFERADLDTPEGVDHYVRCVFEATRPVSPAPHAGQA